MLMSQLTLSPLSTNVNECTTNNGGCDHICSNTKGSYECECHGGFLLSSDKHRCQGESTTIIPGESIALCISYIKQLLKNKRVSVSYVVLKTFRSLLLTSFDRLRWQGKIHFKKRSSRSLRKLCYCTKHSKSLGISFEINGIHTGPFNGKTWKTIEMIVIDELIQAVIITKSVTKGKDFLALYPLELMYVNSLFN